MHLIVRQKGNREDKSKAGLLTIFVKVTHVDLVLGFVVVVVLWALGAVDLDCLLNTYSVLVRGADVGRLDGSLLDVDRVLVKGADAGRLNDGLVDSNGLLDHRPAVVVRSADGGLVDVDTFLDRWSAVVVGTVDNSLVDVDRLLDYGSAAAVVVEMGRSVDNRLGHADVLTVVGLVPSTVLTLDLVNGAVVLLLVVVVVVMWRSASVDFDVSIGVRGTSRSSHIGSSSS